MGFLNISAKFDGIQTDFLVDKLEEYTLSSLIADVYLFTLSKLPESYEKFKVEVKLPWSGEYKVIDNNNQLQNIFTEFIQRKIRCIRVDVELLPISTLPSVEFSDDYFPCQEDHATPDAPFVCISSDSGGDSSEEDQTSNIRSTTPACDTDSEYSAQSDYNTDSYDFSAHTQDQVASDSENVHPAKSDGNGCTEQNSGDESVDEQLSNAASFVWDNDFMLQHSDTDEVQGQTSKAAERQQGRPYREENSGKVKLEVGQMFNTIHHFRQVLREYCVQDGFELKRLKNASWRYTATCAVEGCSWRIHASHLDDKNTFMIKTLNDRHCCQKVQKNQEASTAWVATRFRRMIEDTPDVKVSFLSKEILRIYGLQIPTYTLYRAKNQVLNKTDKEHIQSYNKLYSYGYVVRQRNPGSMVLLRTVTPTLGGPKLFQRLFISFEAQKSGFLKGCRPFLGLDGCHLKGSYSGMLLSAIAIDANNGVYPVALCVCEGESKESWCWFLELLRKHIGTEDRRKITFMSDRQKGVKAALDTYWPDSSSRYCVRHIIANMHARFKGDLNGIYVWDAANCTNRADFQVEMNKLRDVCPAAYEYMMGIPLKHWCVHAFDLHVKSAHTTNNVTEAFNSWVDDYRSMPALLLVESIRRNVMKLIHERYQKALKWTSRVTPMVMNKLAERQEKARYVTVLCASEHEFEVKDGCKFCIVNLNTHSCDCGLWEVSGIPCQHTLAVITAKRLDVADFVDKSLTKEAYMKTYGCVIHPIPDQSLWPTVGTETVLPPLKKRLPGRPKKNRKRGAEEPAKKKRSGLGKCKICGEMGHNKRTCKTNGGAQRKKNKDHNNSKAAAKKRKSEVGNTSASNARRKLNLGDTAATTTIGQSPHGQTSIVIAASTSGTGHHPEQSSQPLSQNAPLLSGSQAAYDTHNTSNPSTVAGLNSDWSPTF